MPKALRRSVGLAVLLVFAMFARVQAAPTEIRVSYGPSNDWLGFFVAMDQNFFDKHGIHVIPMLIPAPPAVMGSVVSGSIDVGGMTGVTFLQGYDNDIPVQMIAGAQALPTPMQFGILARTGSGIKSPSDLVGKKVGLAGIGSVLYAVSNGWLMDHGVDRSKVNFVEIPWSQQADVLKAGQIDAVLTADPFYDQIKSTGIGYSFGDIYESAPPGTLLTTYVALKSWVDAHHDDIGRFHDALQEANDFIISHPDSARASLAKWSKLPPDVVAKLAIPSFRADVSTQEIEWLVKLLKRQDMLRGNPDLSGMIAK